MLLVCGEVPANVAATFRFGEAVNQRTLLEKRADAEGGLVTRDLRQPKSRWSLA
jgi:hypothetical protein